jgi:hypothetical protein
MSATFEQWVQTVFGHSVQKPEWYWDEDFDSVWQSLRMSDTLAVSYLAQLFSDAQFLKNYSLAQVGQGIWFLIGESSPGEQAHALLRPEVALTERTSCVRAMARFFRNFVAPMAPGTADVKFDPFHIACYMWWDIFPTYGRPQAGEPELHAACLNSMSEVLDVRSELCQLSALHGLNHWHTHYPDQVTTIIDAFLAAERNVSSRIRQYALNAREGLCQ